MAEAMLAATATAEAVLAAPAAAWVPTTLKASPAR